LAEGWRAFRSRSWVWLTTLQFSLLNLITWAPYLLLGPVLAKQYLGGATAWGAIAAAYALGSVAAGLLVLGRRPHRLLLVATAATLGIPAPTLFLALRAPVVAVAFGAALAGAGWATSTAFWTTALQRQIAPDSLARVMALSLTGSFALGAIGYATIGPISAAVGSTQVLVVATVWGFVSAAVTLAFPAIRVRT
jgi:hypothetical protein